MQADSLRKRWEIFDQSWAARARSADAAWSRGLSADERLAIVDDLFATIRDARSGTGEWDAIDARAWEATRAERDRLVAALHTSSEPTRAKRPAHLPD